MGRGGGGGRSGGGVRSSGGGGMRHSGGHSGGGSRSGFSGGSRGHSSGSSFSGRSFGTGSHSSGFPGNGFSGSRRGPDPFRPRPVRPIIVNPVGGSRRSGCGSGCGGGCLGSILLLVVVLMICSVAVSSCSVSGKTSSGVSQIQTSTIRRERLNSGSLVSVGWYTDNLDWIRDSDKLEKGLAYFYKRTGVSPYLYLTEDVDGVLDPTAAQLDAFAGELYDTLFRDEAHFLVVFQEHNGVYNTRYVCGLEARAVMDDEACEILLDYLDAYYFGDYDDEEYFAKAFTDAADRIMDTKIPTSVYITGVAVVIGIGVLVWLVWRKVHAYRGEKEPDETGSAQDVTEELLENADAQTRFQE